MKGFKKLLRLSGPGKGKDEASASTEEDLAANLNDSVRLNSSNDLLSSLPLDVKTWTAADVQVWLADEFKEAKDLPK